MNGTFFGVSFSLPSVLAIGFVYLCGLFAFWKVYRALRTGVHVWARDRTSREDAPKLFVFHVGVSLLIGLVAVIAAIMMTFDLGMKI